jgi:hypothetical protein
LFAATISQAKEPQALEYRIKLEISTQYAGAAGMVPFNFTFR